MKKWITAALSLAFLALAVAGARAQVAQGDPNAGVTRITVDELKTLIKSGKAVVVDVRSVESYRLGHLPGSINISFTEIAEKGKSLPKDKTIVTYCS